MTMAKRPVFEHLTRWLITNVGVRETVVVLDVVASWGIARRKLGYTPGVEEYGEFWGLSLSQAYRHQARFRAAFEGRYQTPDPVLDALEAEFPRVFGGDDPRAAAERIARATA